MQKHIIKLLLLIIAFTFALSANYIFAVWTGPTQAPPGGNTPTPVHIGAVDQVKYAGLALNYLAVFGASYFEGNVGIGTMSPTEKLDVVEGNVRISNLPNCNSLATDSNGKIICNVVPPPPPITCVSGSQDFLTPGEFSLVVAEDMKGCKFNFTIKGGGGSSSGCYNGGIGGGIRISDIQVPQTGSHSFGILVGAKGHAGSGRSIGGGGAGDYASGAGASAVKLDSTVLAISGGGGASSYYTAGGDGGSGNSAGKDGNECSADSYSTCWSYCKDGLKGPNAEPGRGGGSNSGGESGHVGARGGSNGDDGKSSVGQGGKGYPVFMVSGGGGGGNDQYSYGAGGGGGYGGGGGGGAGCGGLCNYAGAGGGGGYLNTANVATFQIILGATDQSNGSVNVSWKE